MARSSNLKLTWRLAALGTAALTIAIGGLAAAEEGPAKTNSSEGKKAGKQKRPNIVLVMTDDQSAEQQRFLPKTNAALGGGGATFTNSFVSYSLCCPSRATMLTGQYAHNNGVRGNQPPGGGYGKLAPTMSNTLPAWLQRSGYATAHIGKFLNGYGNTSPDTEVPAGWSEWYGSLDNPDAYSGGTYTMYGYTLNENGSIVHYGATPDVVDPGTYQTDVYSAKAADFINRRAPSRKPFYLSVAPVAAHSEGGPFAPADNNPRAPIRYEGALAGESPPISPSFNEADVSDKPLNIRELNPINPNQIAAIYDRYRARAESLLAVDDLVQNVVSTLKAQGELDNTVIIFTSDNGFFHGEHRVRNGKVRLYEESIRVPLLIRAPGMPRGVKRSDPVANIDLAPTILDFADARPGRHQDGISLAPLIEDKRYRQGRGILLETFFSADPDEDPETPPLNYRAVRTGRYVYAEYGTGDEELYDLRSDPYELTSRHHDPGLARVKLDLDLLLERLAVCSGKPCASRSSARMTIRSAGAKCVAGVAGRGSDPTEALFFVGGRRLGRDASAPLSRSFTPPAGRRAKATALVTLLDGRRVTLTRKLRGC